LGHSSNNPDGQQSTTFNFTVQAATPQIASISPSSPSRSASNQTVTVFGSNFQPGLTVWITFPGGGGTTLSGTQIQNVTSNSFPMIVTLNATGIQSNMGRSSSPSSRRSGTSSMTAAHSRVFEGLPRRLFTKPST
jgi:hypothetical protein